jgi:hypothetical protein
MPINFDSLKITFRLACDDNDKLLEHTFRVAPRIVFTPYFEPNQTKPNQNHPFCQPSKSTKLLFIQF